MITGVLHYNLLVVDVYKKQKMKPECQKRNVAKLGDDDADSFLDVELRKLYLTTVMIYGNLLEVC